MRRNVGKTILSPASLGSPCAYTLKGQHIVVYLFGILPIQKIPLSNIRYLRLATRSEVPLLYLLFNWSFFFSRQRARQPVYVLQTNKQRRIFLPIGGGAHFRLRQAMARQSERPERA
jgi:hypothetical protein